jgi:hypothetical protein
MRVQQGLKIKSDLRQLSIIKLKELKWVNGIAG